MQQVQERISLSRHFFLDEFTRSQAAARHGIVIAVPLDSAIFRNLQHLCSAVLDHVEDRCGPVFVSSGYRPPRLNRLIGGSPSSDHIKGGAGDIGVKGYTPFQLATWIAESDLPFDELGLEYDQWVHVTATRLGAPKREVWTAYRNRGSTRTKYANGIVPMERLIA